MKTNKVEGFAKRPKRALFKLALPIIIGMMVQTLYNVVDTAFVGRLGSEAIAALTFSFPVFFVLIAINSGIAVGMSSRISRYLGANNKTAAENTSLHGILGSITCAIIIFSISLFALKPILALFGASGKVLFLSLSYMSTIMLGVFFMFPSFIISNFFSAQGDTSTPMKLQIIALVLNMVLDPIFIYVLGFGVQGAAIATVISFIVSLVIGLIFVHYKSYLSLSIRHLNFSRYITWQIFKVGIPVSMTMVFMSLFFALITRLMSTFGTDYVAILGIVFRLESMAIMPMIGFATACMTLVGMFYGAKKYHLMKRIVWFSMQVSAFFGAFMCVVFFCVPSLFLRMFTADSHLINLGVNFIRIASFELPFAGVGMLIARSLQGMGKGLPGLIINLSRTLLIAAPAAYFMVFILNRGYLSVAFSLVIGAFCGFIIGFVWLRSLLKRFEDIKSNIS